MVKRIYQKSRVLGGGLPVLRFIFWLNKAKGNKDFGGVGAEPTNFCISVLLHVQPWLSLIGRDA